MDDQIEQTFADHNLENLPEKQKKEIVQISEDVGTELDHILSKGKAGRRYELFQDKFSDPAGQLVQTLERVFDEGTTSSAEGFQGVILGYDEEPSNIRAGMIQRKKDMEEENPKKARQRNHVADDGTPTWSGNENQSIPEDKNVGDPIEPAYIRTYYGIARRLSADEEDVRYFELSRYEEGTDKNFREGSELPAKNVPISFKASLRDDSTDDTFLLNHTNSTAFRELSEDEIDDPEFFDTVELVKNYTAEDKIWELDDVMEELQDPSDDSERFYDPIIMKGEVLDVSNNPNSQVYKFQQLACVNTCRLVSLPDDVDTRRMGDNTEVFVVGRPWLGGDEDDQDLVCTVFNIVIINSTVDEEELEQTEGMGDKMDEATEDDSGTSTADAFSDAMEDVEEEEEEAEEDDSEEETEEEEETKEESEDSEEDSSDDDDESSENTKKVDSDDGDSSGSLFD